MSAWRAARRSIFGPLAPIMIGIRPGRGPTGRCSRSRAAWKVPSKSARPSPQQRNDDLERLLEAAVDVILGQPERVRLRAGVPGAEAEHEPPAADLVERLDGLRGDPGVPMQRGQDPRARPSPARSRRRPRRSSRRTPTSPATCRQPGATTARPAVQTVSNPSSSARTARSRISVQRAVDHRRTSPPSEARDRSRAGAWDLRRPTRAT